MPRVTYDPENKVLSAFNYPKLKLDHNETARILVIEKEPLFEYVHQFRAPQISNGEVVTATVTRDGVEQTQIVYDFIGRFICLGNPEVVKDKGSDPENCPACRAAAESEAIPVPSRRFAAHIFRYQTKPGTFEVIEPYSGQILAWVFADTIFNKLVDIADEWEGGLHAHDLKLGPCQNKQFQKFDIEVAANAEWMKSDQRRAQTIEAYKTTMSKDLSPLLGRRVDETYLDQEVLKVQRRYAAASRFKQQGDEPQKPQQETLDFEKEMASVAMAESPAAPQPSEDPFQAEVSPGPTAGMPAPVQKEEKAPEPPQQILNFDDFLNT